MSYLILKIIQYLNMIEFDLYTTLGIALGIAVVATTVTQLWNSYHVKETRVETEHNAQIMKNIDYKDGIVREVVISEGTYTINKE